MVCRQERIEQSSLNEEPLQEGPGMTDAASQSKLCYLAEVVLTCDWARDQRLVRNADLFVRAREKVHECAREI